MELVLITSRKAGKTRQGIVFNVYRHEGVQVTKKSIVNDEL